MVIYEHSINIGFRVPIARNIERTLLKLIQDCSNQKQALETFEKTYPKYVLHTFSKLGFNLFIDRLNEDIFFPTQAELAEKLGKTFERAYRDHKKGLMSVQEFEEYKRKEREYAKKTEDFRESKIFRRLQEGLYYPILYGSDSIRVIKENPNFIVPRPQFISVPIGGKSR